MKLFLFFLAAILGFSFPPQIAAITSPLSAPNNRFGIHIIDENDLDAAADLVNSHGGEYGYVTLVIRADERSFDKWQPVFNRLRRLKLIPLVRLATTLDGPMWQKPQPDQAQEWAQFLNSLNWVVKNRYVLLFNEPNHAKEWGGDIKPHEYADVYLAFYRALKAASQDFFILPAALDVSAPNGPDTMDAVQFWKFMHARDHSIFTQMDGWNSHSYPNPNFSGKVTDTGRGTVRSYRWEQALLKDFGLSPSLPVFITETGWQHTEDRPGRWGMITPEKSALHYSQAFSSVWLDANLAAVTPFVLNYQAEPFSQFSFTKLNSSAHYPQYQAVQILEKITGRPVIERRAEIVSPVFPATLVTGSVYQLNLTVNNTGQSIFNQDEYSLKIDSLLTPNPRYPLTASEPGSSIILEPLIKTPEEPGAYDFTATVYYQNQPISQAFYQNIRLIPPPSLLVKARTWFKKQSSGSDFSLLLYYQNHLVKKIDPFTVIDGIGTVSIIRDVVPNNEYRFVLTKPYYLPRQTYAVLSPQKTTIAFSRLIPVDFYPDGALTFRDAWLALTHPLKALNLLLAR